jgi:Fe-S cluster assembly iron-binding protein IscA
MLQVTEAAVTAFKEVLETEGSEGRAIRIALAPTREGGTGIVFQAVDGPEPGDAPTQSSELQFFVAAELANALDAAVLDARETETGTELFLRAQA